MEKHSKCRSVRDSLIPSIVYVILTILHYPSIDVNKANTSKEAF